MIKSTIFFVAICRKIRYNILWVIEVTESLYNGFKRIDFEFQSRDVIVVFPDEKNKTDKWMLKTEYFDAFPQAEIELIKKGYHLVYLKNKNRWGQDEDQDVKYELSKYLNKTYELSLKCVPVGMSCGGLHALRLAVRHPDMISMLYLDAPVMNFLSCPYGMGEGEPLSEGIGEIEEAYGFTSSELVTYRDHPIDHMAELIENNITILLVYGDSDVIVPFNENGALLEKYYKEHGGKIKVIGKKGCGHHPHGLEDPSEIVNFILKNS